MSYILEALRRAETERDRGQVPGLNAQPAPAAAPASAARSSPAVRWLVLGAVALLGAALAWWLWTGAAAPPPVVVSAGAAPAATVTPAAEPAQAPAPAALPVVVSAPPPPGPAPVAAPPAAPAANVVAHAPPAAVAKPASSVTEARTVSLASLTAEQRRAWPPLAIGGAVYSEHPASRFVIIGGQLVREGDAAAPGVAVERIGPRSVLLRWRDLRVELPY